MEIQSMLDNMVAAERAKKMKSSPQMTLGEAIAILENSKLTYEGSDGETNPKHVYFDFEYLYPSGVSSWRGAYCELAIEFSHRGENGAKVPTGEEFLAWLKEAVGATYEGYKGGDFVMGRTTPLWVANYGNSGSTGIVGIEVDDYGVTLLTAKCEY